jgi:hypothetical protein
MQKAWGLHGQAQFKDIGDNMFVVRFHSEGDWRHAMKNGPWQFDFNVILLKEFDGSIRPSDMIFDTMDIWVRVLDLPMDMMNRAYGELIGGWVGKYISVDVDEEGMAWGEELRIRVAVRVDQPLLRGVPIKESSDDETGRWFDIKYEKIPHFCFDCGRLVHPENFCSAEKGGVKQWGEWLRASPKKNKKMPPPARPSVSSSNFSGKYSEPEARFRGGITIRDLPPRRNLAHDFSVLESSHTGGFELRGRREEVTGPLQNRGKNVGATERSTPRNLDAKGGSKGRGTFVRRARQNSLPSVHDRLEPPVNSGNRKRGSKQVWLPVPVRVVGEEETSEGKRQRVGSVFDRIEEPSADPARQGRRDQ